MISFESNLEEAQKGRDPKIGESREQANGRGIRTLGAPARQKIRDETGKRE